MNKDSDQRGWIGRTLSNPLWRSGALLLFLACSAACGFQSSPFDADVASGPQPTAVVVPAVQPGIASNEVELRSPLTLALSGGRSVDELIENIREEFTLRGEFMWQCMGKHGFGWHDLATQLAHLDEYSFDDSPLPAIAEHSYGVVPSELSFEWAIEDVYLPLIETARQPNTDPLAGLSDQEHELYGIVAAECSEEANRTIQLQPSIPPELSLQLSDLSDGVESDPRIVAALESWSRCMHRGGHRYAHPQEIYSEIKLSFSQLRVSAIVVSVDVRDHLREALRSDPDEALRLLHRYGSLDERLNDLQQREMQLATADEACRGNLGVTLRKVRDELHQQFMDEHRDLIDQAANAT